MRFTPYPHQSRFVSDAAPFLLNGKPGDARLYRSPTGTGKSTCWAGLLESVPGLAVTVPSIEIAAGIVFATGRDVPQKESELRNLSESLNIWTVKRLHGALQKGMKPPAFLGDDEAHHAVDDTHMSVHDLCGRCPLVGLTGTAFRGTPQGTHELLKKYNQSVTTILTEKEAVDLGYCALPEFHTLPLLDDELIDVSNGEFVVKSVDSAIHSRLGQIAAVLHRDWMPTRLAGTVVLPSAASVLSMQTYLESQGIPCVSVLGGTKNRQAIFHRVIKGEALLLQCKVVGEGVDLPLRYMLDLSPTTSPVLWRQRVGRICRPWKEGVPKYFSGCHNLLRHGYLFEGQVPSSAYIEARKVWGDDFKPSRRLMSRALGLSGLGKFEPAEVPLLSGETAYLYCIQAKMQYMAALLIPSDPTPRYYVKQDEATGNTLSFEKAQVSRVLEVEVETVDGAKMKFGGDYENFVPAPITRVTIRANGLRTATGPTYEAALSALPPLPPLKIEYPERKFGKWKKVEKLPDIQGAASIPKEQMSPGAASWWSNQAQKFGLDNKATVSKKVFQLLPILNDTGGL